MKKVFLGFIIVISLVGCTTSKGSLIHETVGTGDNSSSHNESKGSHSDAETTYEPLASSDDSADFFSQASESEDAGIHFESSPDGARVYVDGAYLGKTPVSFVPAGGSYRITMEKPGYRTAQRWITYTEGESLNVYIELKEITGFVHITTTPPDAQCSVGATSLKTGVNELRVGTYILTVRRFGYEEATTSFAVHEDLTTFVNVTLEKASFRMSDLELRREAFSPDNPGLLGKGVANFEVTTYGTGEYVIQNAEGREVFRSALPRFTDFKQEIIWDGTDAYGNRLPDGVYTLTVTGIGEESGETVQRSATLTVDSSAIIRHGSVFSGNSGLIYAPTADVLPQHRFSASASLVGAVTGDSELFPLQLGVRYGAGRELETVLQETLIIRDPTEDLFGVSLAAKYRLLGPSVNRFINIAATVKATATNASGIDPLTNYSGVSFGIPVTLRAGYFGLSLVPEVTLSPFSPTSVEPSNLSFNAWGYARAGLFFDTGSFMTGLSLALPTEQFDQEFAIRLPFSAGAEVHWLIPGTQIYLSGLIAAQIRAQDDYYFMGGGGFSFLN
ncbi:MAG TPA: PEGA domain-containing protein [Spirochaetia bacterium]|nr:PEGA domain-containing protein [Spirochaetia bacterium]